MAIEQNDSINKSCNVKCKLLKSILNLDKSNQLLLKVFFVISNSLFITVSINVIYNSINKCNEVF